MPRPLITSFLFPSIPLDRCLTEPEPDISVRVAGQKAPSYFLPPQQTPILGYRLHYVCLSQVNAESNSGPPVCTGSVLPTDPSPSPPSSFLVSRLIIKFTVNVTTSYKISGASPVRTLSQSLRPPTYHLPQQIGFFSEQLMRPSRHIVLSKSP